MKTSPLVISVSLFCACANAEMPVNLPAGETLTSISVNSLANAVSAAAKADPGEIAATVKAVAALLGRGKEASAKAEAIAKAAVVVVPKQAPAIVQAAIRANSTLACSFVLGAIAGAPKAAAAIAQAAAAVAPDQAIEIAKAAASAAPDQADAIVAAVQAVIPGQFHDAIADAVAAIVHQSSGALNHWGSGGLSPAHPANIGSTPNESNNSGKTVSDNRG